MNKFAILSLFSILFLFNSCGSGNEESGEVPVVSKKPQIPEKPNKIIYLNSNKIFRDDNDTHLSAVGEIGIEPLASREGIKPYVVDRLVHSTPFLVPEAAKLLHDIGAAFHDSLRNKHLPQYSVIVTSVLRTDADIKSLSRTNVNASKRSVHCYGTTFDITYTRFAKHDDEGRSARDVDLKAVLTEVLRDLRAQGRCYVKYEVKQACFHITTRK